MTQTLIVALIVVLAAGYSLWYVLPAALRQRLGRVVPALARAPNCGSCSECGKCASTASSVKTASKPEQTVVFHRKL